MTNGPPPGDRKNSANLKKDRSKSDIPLRQGVRIEGGETPVLILMQPFTAIPVHPLGVRLINFKKYRATRP